jgi:hypothetical protein
MTHQTVWRVRRTLWELKGELDDPFHVELAEEAVAAIDLWLECLVADEPEATADALTQAKDKVLAALFVLALMAGQGPDLRWCMETVTPL